MKSFRTLFALCVLFPFSAFAESSPAPIKIGVPLSLTGDLAQLGTDMKNALVLINEKLGGGRYELIFEDDQCSNTRAISLAQKFINVDKVKYTLGFACNSALMATAPVYARAGVYVLSGSGTSGDTSFIGKRNYRFFPSDIFGAEVLFKYLRKKHKSVDILAEQSEYAIMMDRTINRMNDEAGKPIHFESFPFLLSNTDFRTLLTKLKHSSADALYIDADSDTSFITILKQLDAIQFKKPRYTVYLGASASVLKEVPTQDEGMEFSNLPTLEGLLSPIGVELMKEFRARFGEPQSGFPVVPPTFESFRVLDRAIRESLELETILSSGEIKDGFLPPYSFDQDGNIQGLKFEMQRVKNGTIETFE